MAAEGLSILFNAAALARGALQRPQLVEIDSIKIDCTLEENHDFEAQITEFEVERGADISDHRRTRPVQLSIAGIVSDTPIQKNLLIEAGQMAAGLLGGTAGAAFADAAQSAIALQNLLLDGASLSTQAFEDLQALFESNTPFTVVTSLRSYDNMVIAGLKVARNAKTGFALPFFLTMREIRFVSTQRTSVQLSVLQSANDQGQTNGDETSERLKSDATAAYTIGDKMSDGALNKARQELLDQGISPEELRK